MDVLQAHRDAGLIDAIYAGSAVGCVLHDVVSAAALEHTLHTFSTAPLPVCEVDHGATITGCMLAPTVPSPQGPAFDVYLSVAANTPQVPAEIEDALSHLAAGREVRRPVHDERPYASATLRTFATGGGAPPHRDAYPNLPCREHLEALVDTTTQVSWYLVLSAPDSGGALTLFGDVPGCYGAAPGALVVFDGGRLDHCVTPTVGARPRRTLGGFAALCRSRDVLYVWG